MTWSRISTIIRLIARIWSLASLLFVATLVIGHFAQVGGQSPTASEWLGLALFPLGVSVGLIVAWWRETIGGMITALSFVGFYAWNLIVSGHFPGGPYFALVAAPCILFLLDAWVTHSLTIDAGSNS